jgi:hypothetical protein
MALPAPAVMKYLDVLVSGSNTQMALSTGAPPCGTHTRRHLSIGDRIGR